MAIPVSPRSTARSTSSVGVNVPSERFVCVWRSKPAMNADGGRRTVGRHAGATSADVIPATVRQPQRAIAFSSSRRKDPEHVRHARLAVDREAPDERARGQHGVRPERERLHDVGAAPDPPVDEDRHPAGDRARDLGERRRGRRATSRADDRRGSRRRCRRRPPPPPARRPRRSGCPSPGAAARGSALEPTRCRPTTAFAGPQLDRLGIGLGLGPGPGCFAPSGHSCASTATHSDRTSTPV